MAFFDTLLSYVGLPYALAHPGEMTKLILQHVKLIGIAGSLDIAVGVFLGILITRQRFRKYAGAVLSVVNIGQTVPSLAVVGLAMGLLGLGLKPAVFALFIYGLLPIVRNTLAGIEDVDPAIVEAAVGMGMTPNQILFRIELPLAVSVIMAGIKTSLVVNVGTAALAFLIGGGGLGDLIFTGIALADTELMLAGAVPTALLAILVDFLLGRIELLLTPPG
mgnify:CR=1 FL=1